MQVHGEKNAKVDFLEFSGWLKLNTDGSIYSNPTSAAMGGLIRDDHGRWVEGFRGRLPECSITFAELWAVRQGLIQAWERRPPAIIIEMDSEVGMKLIQHADTNDLKKPFTH